MRTVAAIVASVLLLVAGAATAKAVPADRSLNSIAAKLFPLRDRSKKVSYDDKMRGATPVFNVVKPELRAWIEHQLPKLKPEDDPAALARNINRSLDRAGLICRDKSNACETTAHDFDAAGYLADISLKSPQQGILILTTSMGILCGFDESAYVYQWRKAGWRRVLADERHVGEGAYQPQLIDVVQAVWPWNGEPISNPVLVLGQGTWCQSNFNVVSFRIWKMSSAADPKLILSETPDAYFGNDPPIVGSIGKDDALIEFRVSSLDSGVHSYETVRHYKIEGSSVARVAPVALGPRSFVEDWLKSDWNDSASWTMAAELAALHPWYNRFHADWVGGEYNNETARCAADPDLWQVGIDFKEFVGIDEKAKGTAYFTVRWLPPYRFEMVAIGAGASKDCTIADPVADEDRTLFPVQQWRY